MTNNNKATDGNWEVIAKKRIWTLYLLAFYVFLGLLLTLAIFDFKQFYVAFFMGLFIDCCFIPPFIFKNITV